MYYIPLSVLIVFSVMEIRKNASSKGLFTIVSVLLCGMLALRYGQGTDYFGYRYNYTVEDMHSSEGWKFMTTQLKNLGVSYEFFIFMLSIFLMFCVYRLIVLYSPYKIVSLLILYPTIYLTYFFSGFRQGLCIAVFLGYMLKWLWEDKWIKYLLACLILITMHRAALILVPLIVLKKVKINYLYVCIIAGAMIGLLILLTPIEFFSFIQIGDFQYYMDSMSISVFGLLERVVLGAIIIVLWNTGNKQEDNRIELMYKVYLIGVAMALMLFPWSMVCSRITVFMKATEIILLPYFLKYNTKWRQILIAFLVCYSIVMTTKNLTSYIYQGGYQGYNALTYPYFWIFNKEACFRQ